MIPIKSPRTRSTGTRFATYLRLDRADQAGTGWRRLWRASRGDRSTARLQAFLRLDRGYRP